jgi:hypothetical protein
MWSTIPMILSLVTRSPNSATILTPTRRSRRRTARFRSPVLRLSLERLEDRTVPTAVTILGSHLVTAGGVAQPATVSGLNVAVNGRDVTFDAPAGTYNLQTDFSQSYGTFTVSSANTIGGTTGALSPAATRSISTSPSSAR